jgi:hypothetical protein
MDGNWLRVIEVFEAHEGLDEKGLGVSAQLSLLVQEHKEKRRE